MLSVYYCLLSVAFCKIVSVRVHHHSDRDNESKEVSKYDVPLEDSQIRLNVTGRFWEGAFDEGGCGCGGCNDCNKTAASTTSTTTTTTSTTTTTTSTTTTSSTTTTTTSTTTTTTFSSSSTSTTTTTTTKKRRRHPQTIFLDDSSSSSSDEREHHHSSRWRKSTIYTLNQSCSDSEEELAPVPHFQPIPVIERKQPCNPVTCRYCMPVTNTIAPCPCMKTSPPCPCITVTNYKDITTTKTTSCSCIRCHEGTVTLTLSFTKPAQTVTVYITMDSLTRSSASSSEMVIVKSTVTVTAVTNNSLTTSTRLSNAAASEKIPWKTIIAACVAIVLVG